MSDMLLLSMSETDIERQHDAARRLSRIALVRWLIRTARLSKADQTPGGVMLVY